MVMRDDEPRPRDEPHAGPARDDDPYADRASPFDGEDGRNGDGDEVDSDDRDVYGDRRPDRGYPDRAHTDRGLHADAGYGWRDPDAPPSSRRNGTGAVVVIAGLVVFGGIIAYAYNQGTRAGTEMVAPVLRADPSPIKVRPEQPGGLQVPHQDKLVYERLNPGAAPSDSRVERLLPPPEAPLERPRAAVQPELAAPEEGGDDMTSGLPADDLPPEEEPTLPPPEVAGALVQPPPVAVQQQAPPPVREGTPVDAAPAPVVTTPETQAAALPPPKAEAPVKKAEPAPPVAAGGVRVQVGAVDSDTKARSEWARLQKLHAAELGGLGLNVQTVDLGAKGIFHRIQGGPVSEFRAVEICAALKAKGAGCIVVR